MVMNVFDVRMVSPDIIVKEVCINKTRKTPPSIVRYFSIRLKGSELILWFFSK